MEQKVEVNKITFHLKKVSEALNLLSRKQIKLDEIQKSEARWYKCSQGLRMKENKMELLLCYKIENNFLLKENQKNSKCQSDFCECQIK